MVVGNAEMVNALMRVKSNLDSGIPQAIQYAATKALQSAQDCIKEHNAIYQRRRDQMVKVITQIGLEVKPPKASLFLWARIPQGYTSIDFATKLLEETGVVVTPGIGYGKYGEGYLRLSLTTPDDRLEEGLSRLLRWHGLSRHKQILT
jgi:LL-diaminopimelate aminotransferase